MNDPPTAVVGFRKQRARRAVRCRLSMNHPPTALVGFRTSHILCVAGILDFRTVSAGGGIRIFHTPQGVQTQNAIPASLGCSVLSAILKLWKLVCISLNPVSPR